jgi:hypothetical protein
VFLIRHSESWAGRWALESRALAAAAPELLEDCISHMAASSYCSTVSGGRTKIEKINYEKLYKKSEEILTANSNESQI